MRIGIITDVHNNLPALEAALSCFKRNNCEQVICSGDIIGIGPYPEETVQRIKGINNLIAVRGNHDNYLLQGIPAEYPNEEGMGYDEMLHHEWEHKLLSDDSKSFLKTLPYRADIEIENVKISVMHYSMDRDNQYIKMMPNPDASNLQKMFENIESDIIVFGHDHKRMICYDNHKWYINVGSLGCPSKERNIARAGILQIDSAGIAIEPIDISYHAEKVVAAIDQYHYPAAKDIKKIFYGVDS